MTTDSWSDLPSTEFMDDEDFAAINEHRLRSWLSLSIGGASHRGCVSRSWLNNTGDTHGCYGMPRVVL